MMKNIFLLLTLLLTMTSCATKYQPLKGMFSASGYSNEKLCKDTHIITYKGYEYTPMATLLKFALIRAAEVSLENGCDYFIVLNSDGSVKNSTYLIGNSISSSSIPSVNLTIKTYKTIPNVEVYYTVEDVLLEKPVEKQR